MTGSIARQRRFATLSILSFLACLPTAQAADEILGSGWDEDPSSRIVGGEKVESCDWPSTLFVIQKENGGGTYSCTATLVHPEIAVTAAHCLNDVVELYTGDGYKGDAKKSLTDLQVDYCKGHPDWKGNNNSGRGKDFAFCKLKKPVTHIKPMPILMGCEVEYLKAGAPITLVGFGETRNGKGDGGSWKYAVDSKVVGFSSYNEVEVGAVGKGSLKGDSGGPAYIKLPESEFNKDAGWRVFGATSVSAHGAPDGRAMYGQLHRFVGFIEKESGVDITPCTDAEGKWDPSENCKEAPLDPVGASGSWVNNQCEPPPYGGYLSTCGKPFEGGDEEAPEVEITSPEHKSVLEADTEEVEVTVDASDDTKVSSVKLTVNGKEQKEDKEEPYEWTLKDLKPGSYELDAVAVDEAGNEGKAKTVKFTIEEEEPEPSESDEPSPDDSNKKTPEETPSDSEGSGSETEGDSEGSKSSAGESGETEGESNGSENGESEGKDTEGDTSGTTAEGDQKDLKDPGGCDLGASETGGWGAALLGLSLLGWVRRRR